jgi:hypothetical protein
MLIFEIYYREKLEEALNNLKMLMADYIENERQNDKQWKNADINKIEFKLL